TRVQRLHVGISEERHRMGFAYTAAAVQRPPGVADVGVTVDGRRESGPVVAAGAAGASRGAGLPRHVLAGPGAARLRRGWQDRCPGAAGALRANDQMLPR